MSHSLGVAIECLVAILLMVTIGYCMLLNKRLKRLKADEHSLKATIAELITATEIAERAIGGLKHTVRDVNEKSWFSIDGRNRNVVAVEEAARRMRRRGPPAVEDHHRGASRLGRDGAGTGARTGSCASSSAGSDLERQSGCGSRSSILRT